MSISIVKWTPPLKSKPNFIGLPPRLLSQWGCAGAILMAEMKSSLSALRSKSCALSCSSTFLKRTKICPLSSLLDLTVTLLSLRMPFTVSNTLSSTSAPFAPETCMAGSGPYKFGEAYKRPIANTAITSKYFHNGNLFNTCLSLFL